MSLGFGFVEASFPSLCNAFKQWHRDIDAKFAVKTKFSNIVAHLETALPSLQPLTTPLDRYLLVEQSRIGPQFSQTDSGLTTFSVLLATFRFG
jgi:hypothetical protein